MKRFSAVALGALSMILVASLALAAGTAPATGGATSKTAPVKTTAKAAAVTPTAGTAKATPAAAVTPVAGAAKATPAAAVTPTAGAAKAAPASGAAKAGAAAIAARPAAALVDLNSASKEELMKLPGIGEAISAKIIAGRPWTSKAQLVSKGLVTQSAYAKFGSMVIARQK